MANKNAIPKQVADALIKGKNLILQELILAELIRLNHNLEKKTLLADYVSEVKERIRALEHKNFDDRKIQKQQNRAIAEKVGKIIEKDKQ